MYYSEHSKTETNRAIRVGEDPSDDEWSGACGILNREDIEKKPKPEDNMTPPGVRPKGN